MLISSKIFISCVETIENTFVHNVVSRVDAKQHRNREKCLYLRVSPILVERQEGLANLVTI